MKVIDAPSLWVYRGRLYAEDESGKKYPVASLSLTLSGNSIAVCDDEEYTGPCRLPRILPKGIEVVAPDIVRGYLGEVVAGVDEGVYTTLLEWRGERCIVAAEKTSEVDV